MTKKRPQVIVCCGGGIDSTAVLHYYQALDFQVCGIHFDYGQPACPGERQTLNNIAKHFGISIVTATIEPSATHQLKNMIVGRNALFILSAINHFQQHSGLVSLGIHAGTEYYDCTVRFVENFQYILDGYLGGSVQLDCPFLNFTKADILAYCKKWEIPVHLTYSCVRNPTKACGNCASCLERQIYGLN